MDLSVNKLGKNNKIRFKGIKGDVSKNNTPVFKFYPPAYDKANKVARLEFAIIETNPETGAYITPKADDFQSVTFDGDKPIELSQKAVKEFSDVFAYRYVIENANGNKEPIYIIDGFRKIGTEDGHSANLIDAGKNYGITPKTGPMRHSFVDSDAIYDYKLNKIKDYDPNFVRNHFNKLGGSLKGLTYLLTKTNELDPYRYVISTPDIGVDAISSHKYWPNNQYQCNNLEEFKEFVFEMYKRGKGYVADGAFTSQGLQSPMVQHVLKWGKQSPFYNMFKVDSILQLGVLPDRSPMEETGDFDYIGVKMVNNPYRKDYDPNKATYIQFFDTRLVKDRTRNKNELIKQYDKEPTDHYDITNHQNSVVPYHFEVEAGDNKRLSHFMDKDYLLLNEIEDLDDFLKFKNFSIVSKAHAAGANYWDGNRDIIKMNLSNPLGSKENREGFFNARNYLLGVASYWSELIQTDLILKTALMNDKERRTVAKNNDIDNFDEIKNSLKEMHYPVLEQNKTVEDYIKAFPLQSIETDESLSAVFAQPDFQKEFFDEYTASKISDIVEDVIYAITPEKYKEDEEYKAYVTKVFANNLIRNLLIGAMCPKALDNEGNTNLETLKTVSLYSLGAQKALTPENERKVVENKLKRAINSNVLKGTINKMRDTLSKIELDDFKLSEAIVLKGKAGLNWRFDASRDIGDLDSIRDGNSSFEYIWYGDGQTPGVQDFWTDFVTNIKKYNPSAYIISEVTNMGWFPWNLKDSEFKARFFKKDAYDDNDYYVPEPNKGKDDCSTYNSKFYKQKLGQNEMANLVEMDFMNKTGSTTISNYSNYFNNLSMFVGREPEHGDDVSGVAGNLWTLKGKMDEMMSQYQPNAAILSHTFVDNHDKPRLLHAMPIDMKLFLTEDLSEASEDVKAKATYITGREDYKNISGAAVAVGLAMKELINTKYAKNPTYKANLSKSLSRLVNGKAENDSEPNYRRAEAFGNLPYEVTIRDLFKGAGINNEEEILDFRFDFIKKYIEYDIKLWEVMNAIVGTPTLFNGTEFFQTGYETPSKNFYVANRNQTEHNLKNDKRFGKYYETMQRITGLYKEPGLSAIRNGFPVSGEIMEIDGLGIWPIYKSDEKGSKVITLVTNNGVPKGDVRYSEEKNKVHVVDSLTLNFGQDVIDDKLVLKRKYLNSEGKYVEDKTRYILEKQTNNYGNSKYVLKGENGEKIRLQGTVETFYVPKA